MLLRNLCLYLLTLCAVLSTAMLSARMLTEIGVLTSRYSHAAVAYESCRTRLEGQFRLNRTKNRQIRHLSSLLTHEEQD